MATTYRDAATAFWGSAAACLYDHYDACREAYFPELPAELPIVIGITAYAHCHGATAADWAGGPRISVESRLFGISADMARDVLLHEMLHAWLAVTGQKVKHDSADWYEAVRRLSPAVLGHEVDINRGHGGGRESRRVPNPDYAPGNGQPRTLVRKTRIRQAITHEQVAAWPGSFRAPGYYQDETIPCPSY